jgi:hypothetical protein
MDDLIPDFGWVLIYVSAFGFSDLYVKYYCKSDGAYLLYYFILASFGVIGVFYFRKCNKHEVIDRENGTEHDFV